MNKHSMKCWLWKVLWALGGISLLGAWISILTKVAVLNIDPGLLLWNALILAVLSISIKLDCSSSCAACTVPKV